METLNFNNLGRLVPEVGDMYIAAGDLNNRQWVQIGEGTGTHYPGYVLDTYPSWGDTVTSDTLIRNYSLHIKPCEATSPTPLLSTYTLKIIG